MPQIARVWFGKTRSSQIEEYLEYVKKTGVEGLTATAGNQGVLLMSRKDKELADIGVISFWESLAAIEGFAGKDIDQAVYYPEDHKFLVKMEPRLLQFEISLAKGIKLQGE